MPRQWRCANGHAWAGDLGALTFCPDCGSADVYEVRPRWADAPAAPPAAAAAAAAGQTIVQSRAAPPAAGDTLVQPAFGAAPSGPGDTMAQAPAANSNVS